MHIEPAKRPEYTVYIDEAFDHFMNLPRMDGYFCYSALMLPCKGEDQLSLFWNALEARLRQAYTETTGFVIQGEFKSTFLKKLSVDVRRDIMQRVRYFLQKNGGFIAGYYTSVHALMCWELRSEAGFADADILAPYDLRELEKKAEELRNEKRKTVGESRLLGGLFHTVAAITASWLGILQARFRIRYDSRDPREDRVIVRFVEDFFPTWAQAEPGRIAEYLGTEACRDSAEVPGLMLVDLICKELRNFFDACPNLLHDGSDYRLITPLSSEGKIVTTEIAGRLFKWGSEKPMSQRTKEEILASERISPFAPLLSRLADNKLSCYAHFGEGRNIDFYSMNFSDQVD